MNPHNIFLQIVERIERDTVSTFLKIKNKGDKTLERNWRLYSSLGLTPTEEESSFSKTLIEGRYGYIEPNQSWQALLPGTEIEIRIENWFFSGMKLLSHQGFYITELKEGKELILGAPEIESSILVPLEKPRMGASPPRRNSYRQKSDIANGSHPRVIPAPKKVLYSGKDVTFDGIRIVTDLNSDDKNSVKDLIGSFNLPNGNYRFEIKKTPSLKDDYQIEIDQTGCQLVAKNSGALSRGLHTFRQLISIHREQFALPITKIIDSPDFEYRGLMIDLARHFSPPEQIRKIIEAMASYKMNKLQLGISNDEGWRLEITSIPELTEIGSLRSHQRMDSTGRRRALSPAWGDGHSDTGGFLSRQDFIGLLKFAAQRGVEIVPELNLPGHANAILRALEDTDWCLEDPDDISRYKSAQGYEKNVVNVGCEDTYRFLRTALEGIRDMYDEAGVKFTSIHLGGDEVPFGAWLNSPICHSLDVWSSEWNLANSEDRTEASRALMQYYQKKAGQIVSETIPSARVGFWHEMASCDDQSDSKSYYNVWLADHDRSSSELKKIQTNKLPFIICNASYYYFDMPYRMAPDEPGLPWAAYTHTEDVFNFDPIKSWDMSSDLADLAIGLQAQLWSETVFSSELMDYYLFPRLLSLAERAWNRKPEEEDWDLFGEALRLRELTWLEKLGVSYRPLDNDR